MKWSLESSQLITERIYWHNFFCPKAHVFRSFIANFTCNSLIDYICSRNFSGNNSWLVQSGLSVSRLKKNRNRWNPPTEAFRKRTQNLGSFINLKTLMRYMIFVYVLHLYTYTFLFVQRKYIYHIYIHMYSVHMFQWFAIHQLVLVFRRYYLKLKTLQYFAVLKVLEHFSIPYLHPTTTYLGLHDPLWLVEHFQFLGGHKKTPT